MTRYHALKTDHVYWYEIASGRKTFELRKNDRDFKVDDYLALERTGTGEHLLVQVMYLTDFPPALRDGYVAMAISGPYSCFICREDPYSTKFDASVGGLFVRTPKNESGFGCSRCGTCPEEIPF